LTGTRRIVAGATYLITRRCLERRFFLRPSAETTALFEYVLAVMAERYGVLIHAYCVASNHFHLALTDPRGLLPDFQRDLGSVLARSLNGMLGRWETFWAPGSYSAVRLLNEESIIEKTAYVLANPVLSGLVRRASEWPGAWSDPSRIGGGARILTRPTGFFRPDGPMPATAVLRLVHPPGFATDAEFVDPVRVALRDAEAKAAARMSAEGREFVGVARVKAQYPFAKPRPGEPRRRMSPRVAGHDKWRRIEALLRLAEFTSSYREAFLRWADGARDVLFPHGTWLMRVRHGVRCAPA
jgi:putative transposase